MNIDYIFGISLTASFLAGVLALFAPCCITFLLPSYLGTIFKDSKKVVLYTFIFAFGLSIVLIPVALGFRFVIYFLDTYHKQVYYFGAFFLMFMGLATVKPIFHLPQFIHVEPKLGKNANAGSVFSLGLVSGITSSCCAPVLFAAVTLTTLSPSLFQAVIVSFAYVLGIVFPLFILSLGYEKFSNKFIGAHRQKFYGILKYAGAFVFILSGVLIAVFNYFDQIQMNQMEEYGMKLRITVMDISKLFNNPAIDLTVFALILAIFYRLVRKYKKAR